MSFGSSEGLQCDVRRHWAAAACPTTPGGGGGGGGLGLGLGLGLATRRSSTTPSLSGAAASPTAMSGGRPSAVVSVGREGEESRSRRRRKWGRGVRDAVFPIYGGAEVKQFALMGLLKFLMVFVVTVTRDTKDTLVVTHCGAEAITFLKVYGVLPVAAAFMFLYARLSARLTRRQLWYATCLPFFAFYALFAFVLYPARHPLHASAAAILPAVESVPRGLRYVVILLQHWTFALFYIVSELWSAVSVNLLFWQFANDIMDVRMAKRFYALFGQVSSLAPMIAGQTVVYLATAQGNKHMASGSSGAEAHFEGNVRVLSMLVLLCGAAMCALYHECNRRYWVSGRRATGRGGVSGTEERKPAMGMRESFRFLTKSSYLACLCALVVGYGLAINFTDVLWKSLVKQVAPSALEYQRFMGHYSSAVGATSFVVVFFGSNIVKRLGWKAGALATPAAMALLGTFFFGYVVAWGYAGGEEGGGATATATGWADLALRRAVLIGAGQTILSKASKYAMFDPTTQMAYIPLDAESKLKGKAAIDVLGTRLGKSGGALLQQAAVMYFGSIVRAAPLVMALFYVVLTAWMLAANRLAAMFEEKADQRERERQIGNRSRKRPCIATTLTEKEEDKKAPPREFSAQ